MASQSVWIFRFLLLSIALGVSHGISTELQQAEDSADRHKRSLVYTYNSATGILFALSVPLLITGRNIFMAYNFEANYGMPIESTDYTQGILKKGDNDQIQPTEGEARNKVRRDGQHAQPSTSSRFTRKKLYRMIELNLTRYGFDGKKCILRMICELASWPVHEGNGVIGDIMQLLFTPSSTRYEKLPGEFYHAEEQGAQHNCHKYRKYCPKDPLDAISRFL
ncbi:uncharacterized protein LOC126572702 [Anopheles aquasalis]|uniref:uncharacterized protein LOC126572702 n=1 Tax=Anopheles aquasalis TaxID=42839 RepID=UPI00215ACC5A|nr:uncharacterized protein LOC126572702 [Anopheles aquasalis]